MIVNQAEECIICKKSFNSLSNDDTYFCRVCDDIQGSVCSSCLKSAHLSCPQCFMPLRKKEDRAVKMGGMS